MKVTIYQNELVITELEFPEALTVLDCLPLISVPDNASHWQFAKVDKHCKKCYGPPKSYRW